MRFIPLIYIFVLLSSIVFADNLATDSQEYQDAIQDMADAGFVSGGGDVEVESCTGNVCQGVNGDISWFPPGPNQPPEPVPIDVTGAVINTDSGVIEEVDDMTLEEAAISMQEGNDIQMLGDDIAFGEVNNLVVDGTSFGAVENGIVADDLVEIQAWANDKNIDVKDLSFKTIQDKEGRNQIVAFEKAQSAEATKKSQMFAGKLGQGSFPLESSFLSGSSKSIIIEGNKSLSTYNSSSNVQVDQGERVNYVGPFNSMRIGFAKSIAFSDWKQRLTEAYNTRFDDGILNVEKAKTFYRDDSTLENAEGIISGQTKFHVAKASSLKSQCTQFLNITNTTFKITSNEVEASSTSKTKYNIRDCILNNVYFESDHGVIRVTKEKPPTYYIANGTFIFESENYTERVEANNSAIIEFDENLGITCVSIVPQGSYWYNHHFDFKKDFGIHLQRNTSKFKLCLKKDLRQKFLEYDGLINFVQRFITLSKNVQYMKYPIIQNQVSSLLMNVLHHDNNDYDVSMQLDNHFSHVERLLIHDKESSNKNNTITNPNDFIIIKESDISKKTHRLAKIHFRNKKTTDPRITEYSSDYFDYPLIFNNNVAQQRSTISTIRFLSPNEDSIEGIVN